jgi:hypothetical protein
MSLYQLMGAPLKALVEAETNAAFATARFIREVGFTGRQNPEAGEEDPEDFGDLRMVTFKHEKINANGEKRTYKVEVPLLSLIPIPALQIRDASLDFFVRIVDNPKVRRVTESEKNQEDLLLPGSSPELPRDMKGTIGRTQSDVSRKSAMDMQIKVSIKMEQADVPAGLSRLFNVMAEGVNMTEEQKTDE